MADWTSSQLVKDWLKLDAGDTADDAVITAVLPAAQALVVRYAGPAPEDPLAGPDARLAATMLAARLCRRRNSPEGVQAITEAGATYVARTDPDIARLLRIDTYAVPRVG